MSPKLGHSLRYQCLTPAKVNNAKESQSLIQGTYERNMRDCHAKYMKHCQIHNGPEG